MKLARFHIYKKATDIAGSIISKGRLEQFLTTPLYTNAIYLMINSAVMALFGFLFWLIVARFYNEIEVGYSSAILSAFNLLAILSLAGFNVSLIRFIPQVQKPQELINTCFTLSGGIGLVSAGIFVAGLDLWSPALGFIKENAVFCLAFLVFASSLTLSYLVDSTFIAKRRTGFILSKNTIYSLLKLPLPLFFILFFHAFGIVASWGVAHGIALIISLFLFLPRVQDSYRPMPFVNFTLLKSIWRYSGSNYLASLLSSFPFYILPLMVVNLLGPDQNAYYYIAWMIASLLYTIPNAISESLLAEGSYVKENLRENISKSFKLTFSLLVPIAFVVILAGKWLLLIFGQSYSVNSLQLLWILTLSCIPLGISSIYISILRVKNRMKEVLLIRAFTGTVVLVLSYLILPITGITGIGYIWLGVHGIIAIYVLIMLHLQSSYSAS